MVVSFLGKITIVFAARQIVNGMQENKILATDKVHTER